MRPLPQPLSRRGFLVTAGAATALGLAGCAPKTRTRGMQSPRWLDPADFSARGLPRSFGDTDPYPWTSPVPADHPIHGIDAARYDGEIDWRKARAGGVRFGWLKATEGGSLLDPGWAINAPGARAAGVPVGAYHFYYFCTSPEKQARFFIQSVARTPGDLPPVLDMEWNHTSPSCRRKPDPATVRAEMTVWLDMVGAAFGVRPVVYASPDFYADNDLGQLAGTEFWLRSVAAHPADKFPGERWSFWQYSGTGVVPGVRGETDLNAFAGSEAAWGAWLASHLQR